MDEKYGHYIHACKTHITAYAGKHQAGRAIRLKEIHIVAAFLLRIYRSDYRQQHQSSNARVTAQIIDSLKGKYWHFIRTVYHRSFLLMSMIPVT